MREEWKNIKKVDEALNKGPVDFHNDKVRIKGKMLLGVDFVIRQVKEVVGWDGTFGTSNFFICLVEYEDGAQLKQATTILPGQPVYKQIKELANKKVFPVICRLDEKVSYNGMNYFILVGVDDNKPIATSSDVGYPEEVF